MGIRGKSVLGQGNSQCKGPGVGSCLVSLRRLEGRDSRREHKEEGHRGNLGPSCPTLERSLAFPLSETGKWKIFAGMCYYSPCLLIVLE